MSAPSGLRLILARHGETPSNVTGLVDTRLPGPDLTDLGVSQAAELADALAGTQLAGVYASEAVRARRTAAPVAARHGLAVQVVRGVHEVEVGELEGRGDDATIQRFFDILHGWLAGDLDVPMPGGETGRAAVARFAAAVDAITAAHRDGTVLLVAHGAILRVGVNALAVNVTPELVAEHRLPNTGRIVLDAEPAGWRCVAWPGIDPATLTTPRQ